MIETKENIVGNIFANQGMVGVVNTSIKIIEPALQEKNATPSEATQNITPDENYDGLSKVTINPIPSEYIVPSGEIDITQNGNYDIKNYATANVNIESISLSDYFYTPITENTSSSSRLNNALFKKAPELEVTDSVTSLISAYGGTNGNTFSVKVNGLQTLPKLVGGKNVTDISNMYSGMSNINNVDLSGLDTQNVTTMNNVFALSGSINSNLKNIVFGNNFNTKKVTSMSQMFQSCRGLGSLDLSSFETPALTNVYHMFYDCRGLAYLDIRKMTFTNVTTHTDMFNSVVPNNCEIIVKSNTEKTWLTSKFTFLTNVKTVAEYENEQS